MAFNFFKPKEPVAAANPAKRNKKRASEDVLKRPVDRVKMEMKDLRDAVEMALDINNPDRRTLIGIYENSVRDPHVHSQIEIAKNKITGADFMVFRNGKEDKAAVKLLKAEWFEDFLSLVLDAELWGHTLVEFGYFNDKGEFESCHVFPRRHVFPFHKVIAFDQDSPARGINYEDNTMPLYLIELGKPEDIGILELIAREVIWKNFARSDWSQASEKFGMPKLYIKTDTTDTKELDRLERMASNFASNGWIITDTDDEVSIEMPNSTDFYKIYAENAKFCDEQISKAINGQTGSSEQKAYTGAAEVHERILDDFNLARLRRCANVINNKLIPFLVYHGYKLQDCKLQFMINDNNADAGDDNNGNPPAPGPEPTPKPGKNKPVEPSALILPGKRGAGTSTPW